MGNKVVLGRDQLIPLVLCDELYSACPEYGSVWALKELALPAWQESYARSCCGGEPRIMFATLDEFMAVTRRLLAASPDGLQRLRAFLAGRYGATAPRVSIYYRKDTHGGRDKLAF